jgi:hypothetical protein
MNKTMSALWIIPAFGLFIGALVWRTRRAQVARYNQAAGDKIQAGIDALDECHCHTGSTPESVLDEIAVRDIQHIVRFKSVRWN